MSPTSLHQTVPSPKFGLQYLIGGRKEDVEAVREELRKQKNCRVFVRDDDRRTIWGKSEPGEDFKAVKVYSGMTDRILGRLDAVCEAPFFAVREVVGLPLKKLNPIVQYAVRESASAVAGFIYLTHSFGLGILTCIPDFALYIRNQLFLHKAKDDLDLGLPSGYLAQNAGVVRDALARNAFDPMTGIVK